METTYCPECGSLAEVLRRDVLESTDGPVEHIQIRCVARHIFYLPVATLDPPGRPREQEGLRIQRGPGRRGHE